MVAGLLAYKLNQLVGVFEIIRSRTFFGYIAAQSNQPGNAPVYVALD
jgi:hypothetical protein